MVWQVLKMSKLKIVVVGNCQARPLAMAFEKLSDEVEVTAIAIVHLLKSHQFDEYRACFEKADYIVTQLVADNYPCEFVRTSFLKEKYQNKVFSIVNLYFTGYTPDWFYIRIPGIGPLKGPMGDYHNRTIFESWKMGLSLKDAEKNLLDKEYNAAYKEEKVNSLLEMKKREVSVDVVISDFIEDKMMSERLFFTFNHPSSILIVEYAKRVLFHLGASFDFSIVDFSGKEPLSKFCPFINVAADFLNDFDTNSNGVEVFIEKKSIVTGESCSYAPAELVSCFYKIYDFFATDI